MGSDLSRPTTAKGRGVSAEERLEQEAFREPPWHEVQAAFFSRIASCSQGTRTAWHLNEFFRKERWHFSLPNRTTSPLQNFFI